MDAGRKSCASGKSLTPQAGYGIIAGIDFNPDILRLGAGIRWQVFYAGNSGEIRSVTALPASLKVNLVLDTPILGIEYAYSLTSWIKESEKRAANSISTEFSSTPEHSAMRA